MPKAMPKTMIEHVNLTVSDGQRSAELFSSLFDWHVRWQGPGRDGGHSIHVGDATFYLVFYTPSDDSGSPKQFAKGGALNHVGLLVDDLLEIKQRVIAAGLETFAHERYDPGERFYFFDWDGIEYEIVSYA